MEDLTKTQIVLLTLLVSFITSIATGIITTSLLASAPASVTQTIDRVVEHTIEKVTPQSQGGSSVREVTVVKEDDAIVSSVQAANDSLVRIYSNAGGSSFYALGAVINSQGLILTDKRNIIIAGAAYTVTLPDGTAMPANVWAVSDDNSFALFKLSGDASKISVLKPMPLAKDDPKLGQTVIALEGRDKNAIAVGRVLTIDSSTSSVLTDIDPADETPGGPLVNLSGELVGLKTSNADLTLTQSAYTMVTPLAKFIALHS